MNSIDLDNKLNVILIWSKYHRDKFDPKTFIGIKENFDQWGTFTILQGKAIDKVWEGWRIEQWRLRYPHLKGN